MRLTFRSKLLGIVATAALALVILVVASGAIARKVDGQLDDIHRRYLPRIGLRPQLQSQLERIQRGFQDAVAASDREKLAATSAVRDQFLRQLESARGAIDPALAQQLAQSVQAFYDDGQAVSGRLIAGEAGEALVEQMAELQRKQKRAADLLERATAFDEAELSRAFAAAEEAQRDGARVRLWLSIVCLLGVLTLSLWISRRVLRSLGSLTEGFKRFGAGDFETPIVAASHDELADVAQKANLMAESLRRADWLKGGQVGLAQQLRGELAPSDVADRVAAFLARYLGCPVAAFYAQAPDGDFTLAGGHALPEGALRGFRLGEGLLGETAAHAEVRVVGGAFEKVRSGTAEAKARAVALVPLLHDQRVVALLELVSLEEWRAEWTELLVSVRETAAIALQVASGRAELHRQRAALEDNNATLLDARRRLEQQAEELVRASAYKSQFLANMSHELRTPLNAIIGFAQLLHDEEVGKLEEQQKDFLGDVLKSGQHLLQLINDVLDLSKVEAGKLDFRPERIEPAKLVGEVLGILRSTAAARRVHVQSQIDPDLNELSLDPARLKQVLYNYLSNALKFTPEGGTVTIRLKPEGVDRFLLEVEDTGKGISEEGLARLFVEFQQINEGDNKHVGGTGLGLALTKRLVEAQGGKVGVSSVQGKGSTFWAVLPRRLQGTAPASAPAQQLVPEQGKPSVLIIEDNQADSAELSATLSRAGYAVQVAGTGAAAVKACQEHAFDAITLDILLPDMSGLEALKAIRAEGKSREAPVVVITVVAERGAVAGFAVEDILSKPIDAPSLLAALGRVQKKPDGEVMVIDDDPGSLKLVAAALKQGGYRAQCQTDGAAALESLRISPPSAVILDLMMPGMNGFEFLERLRHEPAGQGVPVIVWTVKDLTGEERDFLRARAHAVVSKGQGGSGVLAELAAVVRSRSWPANPS